MADTSYGVYVRIQNPDGALFSSSREELSEVLDDLETLGGAEFKGKVLDSLKKGFIQIQQVQAAPVLSVVNEQVDEEAAFAQAEAILTGTTTEAAPQQQFEKCEICGGVKDQWKPPGVSGNGKKYPGFWGCNNFRNHPRNR